MRHLLTTHLSKYREAILHLQSIGKSLVQLGDLGGDAEVDGAVTDLDNESTDEVRVDLELVRMCSSHSIKVKYIATYSGDNLELLALAVLGLGDGLLEAGDGLGIELL